MDNKIDQLREDIHALDKKVELFLLVQNYQEKRITRLEYYGRRILLVAIFSLVVLSAYTGPQILKYISF